MIVKMAGDRDLLNCTVFFVFRLPVPTVPNFSLMPDVLSDAFALSIVVFAISVSMGKILARKHGYEIDSNQVKIHVQQKQTLIITARPYFAIF